MKEAPIDRAILRARIAERLRSKRFELDQTRARMQSLIDQIEVLCCVEDDVNNIGKP